MEKQIAAYEAQISKDVQQEDFSAQWDKRTGKEIFMPGARVKVAHKGRMVVGKVVRYDKAGGPYRGMPFYVVDVGEYESKIVPAKDTEPLREAVDNTSRRYSDAQSYVANLTSVTYDKMLEHIIDIYDIPKNEARAMILKEFKQYEYSGIT